MNETILVGQGDESQVHLLGKYANRHGLVAGATGTGKTVTLMMLAEGFSRMGVPVFMADVKGDMAGLSMPGAKKQKIRDRAEKIGLDDFAFASNPVSFWDLWDKVGNPIRTSVESIGATLMARMLDVSDAQEGVLDVAYHYARECDMPLETLKDFRKLLSHMAQNRESISTEYGLINASSIGAIQRRLLTLENDGIDNFFGTPALELSDFMREQNGRGMINILSAESLILRPRMYSTFLLWLLSELFDKMPEIGDVDKPKLVFFFDEAHLLFDDCSGALLRRVEQVVRLIRSKGVGIYFCSQNPDDIPETVLGQLGNRVQHALRAFTPRDQKAVKAAAETFVDNPNIDVIDVITRLGVGEALTSMLDDKGIPQPVQRTMISPPQCRLGSITEDERSAIVNSDTLKKKYAKPKPVYEYDPDDYVEPISEHEPEPEPEPESFGTKFKREFLNALLLRSAK